jgi:hypothetical protein
MPEQGSASADLSEKLLNAVGGAALGALIAMILALAHTPVASATLSVLIGGAIVFLALQENILPQRAHTITKVLLCRIIGFSVAALVALLIGVHLRATNALGENDSKRLYDDLTEIGITPKDARVAVLERVTKMGQTANAATERRIRTSSLFSDDINEATCAEMKPGRFSNVESAIATYTTAEGVWPELAERAKAELGSDDSVDGMSFIRGMYAVNCNNEMGPQ